ncbi:MAG: imidazole glycerol phosphate synthase subunit HisH [Gammaproteobacteria bacterium]|nr:imidazole glycerol phosphate synthase subunit HisH [Gammaproteobacteria bacterium]
MTRQAVAIIDSGGANIASLRYALRRIGADSVLTSDPARIRDADRVILPGVGAAAAAMERLRSTGIDALIGELTQPVLGICLGMQLLASASEEDEATCLGIIEGTSGKLAATPETPVPNMGWCPIRCCGSHPLLDGIGSGDYFYFVHSYALPVADYTLATADHGGPFTAILARANFVATQFHPERSAVAGSRLLVNFLRLPA